MNRCVIVGNADILNYNKIKKYLTDNDFIVFCDGGLKHKEKLGVNSDFIIGDFDSYEKPANNQNLLILPCEKDDTDTFAAVKLFIKKGYREFLLIGVTGNRLDHTFGNISILLYLNENSSKGTIIDDYGEISLLNHNQIIKSNSCNYFSVIALEKINNISIMGAKYPLDNASIDVSWQYAISNEPLNDVKISFEEGKALLIKII